MTRELFATRCVPEPNSGCWLWMGVLDKDGYGKVGWNHRSWRAHRAAYVMWRGEFPEEMNLDHLCRTRCCVNPWHLEPVTCAENLRRGVNVGVAGARWLVAFNKAKTHCPQGHPYDATNTGLRNGTQRWCRTCQRARVRKWRDAQKRAG